MQNGGGGTMTCPVKELLAITSCWKKKRWLLQRILFLVNFIISIHTKVFGQYKLPWEIKNYKIISYKVVYIWIGRVLGERGDENDQNIFFETLNN